MLCPRQPSKQSARTLADFRGNYKYSLLDANLRAFNAEVPMFAMWDDHEVTNDWVPADPRGNARGDVRMRQLVANGSRAFHEFKPIWNAPGEQDRVYRKISYGPLLDIFVLDMRSYRDAFNLILGAEQLAWLKRGLSNSKATWKVIAADLPIGVVNTDGPALGSMARAR